MKRCVVQFRDGNYANLDADSIHTHPDDGNIVIVRKGQALIGIFDLSVVMAVYLSEKREEQKKQQT